MCIRDSTNSLPPLSSSLTTNTIPHNASAALCWFPARFIKISYIFHSITFHFALCSHFFQHLCNSPFRLLAALQFSAYTWPVVFTFSPSPPRHWICCSPSFYSHFSSSWISFHSIPFNSPRSFTFALLLYTPSSFPSLLFCHSILCTLLLSVQLFSALLLSLYGSVLFSVSFGHIKQSFPPTSSLHSLQIEQSNSPPLPCSDCTAGSTNWVCVARRVVLPNRADQPDRGAAIEESHRSQWLRLVVWMQSTRNPFPRPLNCHNNCSSISIAAGMNWICAEEDSHFQVRSSLLHLLHSIKVKAARNLFFLNWNSKRSWKKSLIRNAKPKWLCSPENVEISNFDKKKRNRNLARLWAQYPGCSFVSTISPSTANQRTQLHPSTQCEFVSTLCTAFSIHPFSTKSLKNRVFPNFTIRRFAIKRGRQERHSRIIFVKSCRWKEEYLAVTAKLTDSINWYGNWCVLIAGNPDKPLDFRERNAHERGEEW